MAKDKTKNDARQDDGGENESQRGLGLESDAGKALPLEREFAVQTAEDQPLSSSGAPLRGNTDPAIADNKNVTAQPASQEVGQVGELGLNAPKSNLPQTQPAGGIADATDQRSLQAQEKKPSAAVVYGDATGREKLSLFASTYNDAFELEHVVAGRAGDIFLTLEDLENGGEGLSKFVEDFPDTPDSHVVAQNGGLKLTLGDLREALK